MPTIVDTHCHVFSVREIPFRGYLESRFEKDPLGRVVLVGILERMVREQLDRVERGLPAHLGGDPLAAVREAIGAEARTDGRFRRMVDHRGLQTDLTALEKAWQGNSRRLAEPKQPIDPTKIAHMAWLFAQRQPTISEELIKAYPLVDLFTPLMMDMWMWFDDEEAVSPRGQMKDLARIVIREKGRIHPFVAFDPKREATWLERHGGDEGPSLRLVKDAVEKHGFLGVKLYPPMGYRATGNALTLDERGAPYGSRRGGSYDKALASLYQYCVDEDVPITAHTTNGGAQSHHGFGANSNPIYWETVLQDFPNLRLNFAHFGGYWHLAHRTRGWTTKIVELMNEYPNVYADTSFHLVFNPLQKSRYKRYFANLKKLYRTESAVRDSIMYGSDWHMFVAMKHVRDYLPRFTEEYAERFGDSQTHAFLGENALNFLGLDQGRNRIRLKNFYRAHDLFDMTTTFPRWWVR